MPVPMRAAFHKAEAKFNVTTEFPNLGLHAAAATGNVGLVEYALNNGQPINSVLDGVLPLHAACAGGNVQVVKLLIDHGADVNASRLPRKYSLDKGRDTSAPIVGTSGSTPLHFAAANGNTDVVLLLLMHGAHPNRADKHGVTPEMLARQNHWVECARVLSDWVVNKDRDLREREPAPRPDYDMQSQSSHSYSPRRRLHVKHSIDTALNMLKTSDHSRTHHPSTPPASPHRPFGDYTFYPTDQSSAPVESGSRRPSLPHILHPHSADAERPRKNSAATTNEVVDQRRPRSAGTGADRADKAPNPVYGRATGRKLNSKYSLLNLFKKGQSGDIAEGNDTPERSVPGSTITLPLSLNSSRSTPGFNDLPDSAGTPSSLPTRSTLHPRGSDASVQGRHSPQPHNQTSSHMPPLPRKQSGNLQTPPRTNVPLAVELHLALAEQHQRAKSNDSAEDADNKNKPTSPLAKLNAMLLPHNRHRSGSASSMLAPDAHPSQDDDNSSPGLSTPESENSRPSPSPRAGILRAHNRTNSSGQGSSPLNPRNLRFDSTVSTPSSDRRGRDSPRSGPDGLRSYNSVGSFTKMHIETNADSLRPDASSKSSSVHRTREELSGEGIHNEEPEEYFGQPIHGMESSLGGGDIPSVLLQRQRGLSFTSSSESSLSPILSNENANDPTMAALNADFPFSINRPPSLEADAEVTEKQPTSPGHLSVPIASSDMRGRGDSLSSNSTTDSRMSNALMSSGTTSGSGGSATISTPNVSNILTLSPGSIKSLDTGTSRMHDLPPIDFDAESFSVPTSSNLREEADNLPQSRLDIDIKSISSHAQAEELVQRTRQEVLDVANSSSQELSPLSTGAGRSPLSARLAAYGEILALERKLREKENAENSQDDPAPPLPPPKPLHGQFLSPAPPPRVPRQRSGEGVERQLSLETKADKRAKRRTKDPRRPSTADGVSPSKEGSFFQGRTPSHQSSLSASSSHPLALTDNYTPSDMDSDNISASYGATSSGSLNTDYRTFPASISRNPMLLADDSLSRINSSDLDTETDTPHRGINVPATPRNQRSEHLRSAKKLTKMGIPVANQAAATASRSASASIPTTPPSGSKRFVKSIIQTFKGKA